MRNEKPEFISQPEDYDAQLQAILSRQLTPENIDEYAGDALVDLVSLVDTALIDYDKQPTIMSASDSTREKEDEAFSYFGMSGIEESLDHIAGVADSIHRIDDVIARAKLSHTVIIPTDPTEVNIVSGNGNFQPKKATNRLKTVLFSLEHDFGIDLENLEQMSLNRGDVPEGIMREASYYMIDITALDRVMFVCDEENNVTYVFNRAVAAEYDITALDLAELGKSDLDDLLKGTDNIGCRIVYSKNFLLKVKKSLRGDFILKGEEDVREEQYLKIYKKAPEGYLSANGVAKMYFITEMSVYNAVANLNDELGEVDRFMFGSQVANGYSPNQIEIIRISLEKRGVFTEHAPEGYLSINGVADVCDVDRQTVARAITELGDELGEVRRFKFRSQLTNAYSPDQIETIRNYLEQKGLFLEQAPKGYLSVKGIADVYGVVSKTVFGAIADIGDGIGEVRRFKFISHLTNAYSPDQIEMIRVKLEQEGFLIEHAPEGYLSAKGIAHMYSVSPRTVAAVIAKVEDELGVVERFKFGPTKGNAYSPGQIETIHVQLEQKGLFVDHAPEGYLSVGGISNKYTVDDKTVFSVIAEFKDKLGEIATFRFGSQLANAYSPDQIKMIIERVNERILKHKGKAAIAAANSAQS